MLACWPFQPQEWLAFCKSLFWCGHAGTPESFLTIVKNNISMAFKLKSSAMGKVLTEELKEELDPRQQHHGLWRMLLHVIYRHPMFGVRRPHQVG